MFFQSIHINIATVVSIDDLISHMRFHNETYGDNFFVFLSKHYGELKEQHHKQQEHEQGDHERLPFNNNHHCHHPAPVVFFVKQEEAVPSVVYVDIKETHFIYTPPFSSAHLSGILQPPRYS